MTYRDHPCGPSGRREVAGDAGHRQGFPTPPGVAGAPPVIKKRGHPVAPGGPHGRPQRRLAKAFGQRRARLAMCRIATPGGRGGAPRIYIAGGTPPVAPPGRSLPKTLASRPYGSLSPILGISRVRQSPPPAGIDNTPACPYFPRLGSLQPGAHGHEGQEFA